MNLVKSWRVQNTKLMDQRRNEPCVITGNYPPNDPHHIKSRGAMGDDVEWNIVSLKHELHQEFHKIGINSFAKKYPKIEAWLIANGWTWDEFRKKWHTP
jgi:hypothetical protein